MAAAGTNEDPTWHLFFFVAIIGGLSWGVWRFFQTEILEIMRYVRLAEMYAIAPFDSQARACLPWLRQTSVGTAMPSVEVFQSAVQCFGADNLRRLTPTQALGYYNFSVPSLSYITGITKNYLRWLTVLVCAAVGYYTLYMSPRNKFKTRHTLESFINIQAKVWPVISPILKFNPTKHSARAPGDPLPDKLPLFAEALSPEEWVSFHRIPVVNGIPDREMVRRAFLPQLGPYWQGLENLPVHALALFAAFALMGAQKRDESENLLGRLATCWSPEHGFRPDGHLVAEVKKIAHDPAVGGHALKIAGKHAYRTTALLAVLKWARFQGGVLAPAYFLWLRATDRALWYPLNNLGRRAFHAEAAGAMAHFMAEEAAGKALPIPRTETAIVPLNKYLAELGKPLPPREGEEAADAAR